MPPVLTDRPPYTSEREGDLDGAHGTGRWEIRRARSDGHDVLQCLSNVRHDERHDAAHGCGRGSWGLGHRTRQTLFRQTPPRFRRDSPAPTWKNSSRDLTAPSSA